MQTGRDLYSQWLLDLKDAAQELRQRVKKVKSCRMQCGDVLGAALAVVMALEQAMLMDRLDERSKEVPEVFAEAVSTIELAQALVQVNHRATNCHMKATESGIVSFDFHTLASAGMREPLAAFWLSMLLELSRCRGRAVKSQQQLKTSVQASQ